MVVAASELYRAEVREDDRGVVGVCLDDGFRNDAVAVELAHEPDEELDEPARQLVENVHGVGSCVACTALFLAAYLLVQLIVQRIKGGVLGSIDEGKALLRGVAELFFDDK